MNNPPDFRHRGIRFDATINLGHIVSAMMMAGALLTMWTSLIRDEAITNTRVTILETTMHEQQDQQHKMNDTQNSMAITEARLAQTIDWIVKGKAQ